MDKIHLCRFDYSFGGNRFGLREKVAARQNRRNKIKPFPIKKPLLQRFFDRLTIYDYVIGFN
jgi:hypothetical protein